MRKTVKMQWMRVCKIVYYVLPSLRHYLMRGCVRERRAVCVKRSTQNAMLSRGNGYAFFRYYYAVFILLIIFNILLIDYMPQCLILLPTMLTYGEFWCVQVVQNAVCAAQCREREKACARAGSVKMHAHAACACRHGGKRACRSQMNKSAK